MAPSYISIADEPNPKQTAYILTKGQVTYLRRRNRALYYDLLRDRSIRNNVLRVARQCYKNASIVDHVVRNNPQFRIELENHRLSLAELMDTCSLARSVVSRTRSAALDSYQPRLLRPFRQIDLKKFARRFGAKASDCLLHSKNIVVNEPDTDSDTDYEIRNRGSRRYRSPRRRHRSSRRDRSAHRDRSDRRDRSDQSDRRDRSPSRRVRRSRTETTASPSRRINWSNRDDTASPSRRINWSDRNGDTASPSRRISRSRTPRSERPHRRERRGRRGYTTDGSTDTDVETTTTRRTKRRRTVVTTTTVENAPSEDSDSKRASDNESQASLTGAATDDFSDE